MIDLYDLYEQLLPPMADVDFEKLPSPRNLLETAHYSNDSFVGSIEVIKAGVELPDYHYVVIKLGDTFVKISSAYSGEYGLDYDYTVQIVKPVEITVKTWQSI